MASLTETAKSVLEGKKQIEEGYGINYPSVGNGGVSILIQLILLQLQQVMLRHYIRVQSIKKVRLVLRTALVLLATVHSKAFRILVELHQHQQLKTILVLRLLVVRRETPQSRVLVQMLNQQRNFQKMKRQKAM